MSEPRREVTGRYRSGTPPRSIAASGSATPLLARLPITNNLGGKQAVDLSQTC